MSMELVTETSRKVLINGTEVEVCIEIHTETETESVEGDFDFGNAEENAAYLKKFETGELDNVCIRVQATLNDLVGSDYLGMCHVHANSKFSSDVLSLVDDHSMIENAIDDLKSQINNLLKKLGAS